MQRISPYLMVLCLLTFLASPAAAIQVDIYGPGQNILNLALCTPISGPKSPAGGLAPQLDKLVHDNLNMLPFMRLTSPQAILGGNTPGGYEPPSLDFKPYQLAGAEIVVSAYWPNGSTVQMRAFETATGSRIFGKEYPQLTNAILPDVADRFCADLLEVLTGNGAFFRSTLTFVRKTGRLQSDVWLIKPTGRNAQRITSLKGEAMSPAWSPDGRFIVFTHIDHQSHALGVWDRRTRKVQRIRFPGNTVIGPAFMPDNKVAVSLSNGRYPDIFLLNHVFQRERPLEQSSAINVSPTFDSTGTKMAFTSNRLGGPQIFLKDLASGSITRVSKTGSYNTEANISPDGTLVAYSRMTSSGHRIFVQDMLTGAEMQVTFGPGSDEQPSFCADSYFLAFTSTRDGGRNIYLTTRHGGDAKKVPTGGGASFPRWGLTSGK